MQSPSLDFWSKRRLPALLQAETSECGMACVVMVARYWGHRIDQASMRLRHSISIKGSTLRGVIRMAEGLSLQARAVRIELAHLQGLSLPCILHWNMNHFVVLREITRDAIVVHDPALGVRKIPMNEVSSRFTGVALELRPAAAFAPVEETQRFSLFSLMGQVVGLRRGLGQLLVMAIALQVLSLVAPFYLQWIVDEALVAADRDLVTVLGIGFALLAALQAAIGAGRSWMTTVLATNLNFQWLGNAFSHLMKLPIPYFEKRHVGDIVSRFGSIQAIQRSLTSQFVEAIIDGLLVTVTLAIMLLYSGRLTAIACVSVALYALFRGLTLRSVREATAEQIYYSALQQSHMFESARGIQSIRLFNRGGERQIGWLNTLADQFNAELRIARFTISQQAVNALLLNVERVVSIWLAARAVLDHQISVGMLLAFLSYKEQFSQRTSALVDKLIEFRMLRLHGERVADLLLARAEEDRGSAEVDVEDISPRIEVRKVSFRYAEGEPYIVKELDLVVPAGQCLAISGASGCGKTTLVKLLLGLLAPTEGEILVGGVELTKLGLRNYRAMIGTVMQEDHLFAGSIFDNITFFDPEPDRLHVEECARQAAIHEEIKAMPMAYHTLVGDIGTGLSGGQKQRVLLARALYKKPTLLFLDEATSHLDLGNEHAVNAAIKRVAVTRVIVAHRPETIAMAQRVVVLEHGRIVRDLEQSIPAGEAVPAVRREP